MDSPLLSESTKSTPPSSISNEERCVDPIAVVGFSLKFPQEARDAESFWKVLMDMRCTATEYPEDRLSKSNRYHPDPNRKDTFSVSGAHFLQDKISTFDAPFFSIGATEAAALDPQHRGLLETTYRALENSGLPLSRVDGTKTSVYTGSFTNDWQQLCYKDSENSQTYVGMGSAACMTANRINWFFNFTGGSANIDTACSSSLVALHLACQDLLSGDVDMSIAAGCNLIFSPDWIHLLSNMKMLSPDYRSYSFDSRANGYSRSEGLGVLVLKRLSSAIADGNTIRAIIRASGSNQDGLTPGGIMQPSRISQEILIREVYQKAGLSMDSTRFVESHGTGTAIGDPIEAAALGSAFKAARTLEDPLYVGALKSNIGHMEGASGIAGVIKAILVLEKAIIPPNANFERLNPRIDAEFLKLKFPICPTPWPTTGLRRASVNSFGFGGTNAHIVLDDVYHYLESRGLVASHNTVENAPSYSSNEIAPQEHLEKEALTSGNTTLGMRKLFVFTANDPAALKRVVDQYATYFKESVSVSRTPDFLARMSYTLTKKRTMLKWRTHVVTDNLEDLRNLTITSSLPILSLKTPLMGFVFTGQGAQWACMGLELLKFQVFARSLAMAEQHLKDIGSCWSLSEKLSRSALNSDINNAEFSQPICTAVQIALVDLLKSFNIHPNAVVGHSSGEIAASYCIGALSAKSALRVAYFRGKAAAKLSSHNGPTGAMMSIGLPKDEAQKYIDQISIQNGHIGLTVACINSNRNVTVSGDETQIDELRTLLKMEAIPATKLKVNIAYHSYHMEAIALEYESSIQNIEAGWSASRSCIMISTVTGRLIESSDLREPSYWVSNMVSPVRFYEAMQSICGQTSRLTRKKLDCSHRAHICVNMLIEVGPHSALQGPIQQILSQNPQARISYSSMLHRKRPAEETALNVVCTTYCLGAPTNIDSLHISKTNGMPGMLLNLPEYPFDQSVEYWYETKSSKRNRLHPQGKLDLLGKPSTDWNPMEARWRNFIRVSDMPWVEDHVINGSLIYPAAGMLVMAIEAANQIANHDEEIAGFQFKDVVFPKALSVPLEDNGVEVHFYLRRPSGKAESSSSWLQFRLCTCRETNLDEQWEDHFYGFIKIEYGPRIRSLHEIESERQRLAAAGVMQDQTVPSKKLYETLKDSGYNFGPSFQTLEKITYQSHATIEACASVRLYRWPDDQFPQQHIIHPTTLDGMLHSCLAALAQDCQKKLETAVPSHIRRLSIAKSGLNFSEASHVLAIASGTEITNRYSEFNISVLNSTSENLLMRCEGLRMTVVTDTQDLEKVSREDHVCHILDFQPDIDLLGPDQLSEFCAIQNSKEEEPKQFYSDLLFLTYVFLVKALQGLGATKPSLPYLQKYIDWARYQVERYNDGALPYSQQGWEILMKDEKNIKELISRVESKTAQGRAFVATGQNILPILRGEISSQEFLFKSDLAKDLYKDINNNRVCFPAFQKYLEGLSYKNPRLRILEIGAGTGGTTSKVLQGLCQDGQGIKHSPRYMEYTYTDISAFFFETAQEDFKEFPRMSYRLLDIEDDPIKQGFAENSFDLIVAGNVLHATVSIVKTMKHVRKLLKPGGKLMMHEITRPDILRSGFIFGLLPGWWLATDPYRHWGPAISSQKWDSILLQHGFSGIDVELPEFASPECQEQSIIISTASFDESPNLSPIIVTIVVDTSFENQKKAANDLQNEYSENFISSRILHMDDFDSDDIDKLGKIVSLLEIDNPILFDLSNASYISIQSMLTCASDVVWVRGGGGRVVQNPAWNMIEGITRAVRNEGSEKKITIIALEFKETEELILNQAQIRMIYQSSSYLGNARLNEHEYVEVNGLFTIPRAIPSPNLTTTLHQKSLPQQISFQMVSEVAPAKLTVEHSGSLETLHFVRDQDTSRPLKPTDVDIEVRAVGMSRNDCQSVLGRLQNTEFGREACGVVVEIGASITHLSKGDRVVVVGNGLFKTLARCEASSVWKIPEWMSFEGGAGISIVFLTAWNAVSNIARVQSNETILIHEACEAVGQAAVQLAQHFDAEIFASCRTSDQRNLLLNDYGIPDDHIILLDNKMEFKSALMHATEGRGMDVIINSLTGDGLTASWECIGAYGRFVDISQRDAQSNLALEVHNFRKNASFSSFDVFSWLRDRPKQAEKDLGNITQLFKYGSLRTVHSIHINSLENIASAFSLLQEDELSGKAVIELKRDDRIKTLFDTEHPATLSHDSTYVISGAFGGIGRAVVSWLASRGAKYLILLSRSGPKDKLASELLESLRAQGIEFRAPRCDITDRNSLSTIVAEATLNYPPIKGCIQTAMVLKDSSFINMSYEDWNLGTQCKTQGSWNLHCLLPTDLDFFVMLSSLSGVIGIHGQANYGSGNTFMDALARHRISLGQRAVAWDLGIMAEDGFVAEDEAFLKRIESYEVFTSISRSYLIALLDYYCDPNISLFEAAESQVLLGLGAGHIVQRQPLFSHTLQQKSVSKHQGEAADNYRVLFEESSSMLEAGVIAKSAIVKKLARVLPTLQNELELEKPLHFYGVDSLLSLELRSWIAREYLTDVTVFEIQGGASFDSIGMLIARRSKIPHSLWSSVTSSD
ncbi:putative polyketide synthase protein [Botrytis fragariae]|uniref:Putative polyketide synthase protein n=1 Tax=Botrytis fragariae TaxID=1964551 RepID=A0A8H6EHC6_9HELO|nr:putative polyketide synthase protein [Botrytis fragariae]KAF5872206.1 putative polyketide synthase protein [Botrytis fragariae]